MVANIRTGATVGGAIRYNEEKVNRGKAVVLFWNRVLNPFDATGHMSHERCMASFEPFLQTNRRTTNTVFHVSLNPSPEDRLNDEQLGEIAREYMERMGYGEQPYIVFKHRDIAREHLHIVSLRIDREGRKLPHDFEARRSVEITRDLERKYGLPPSIKGQELQDREELRKVDYQKGDVKQQVSSTVRSCLQHYRCASFGEWRTLLEAFNVSTEERTGTIDGRDYAGMIYGALTDDGYGIGTPFKSSRIGKDVGYEALQRYYERSKMALKEYGVLDELRSKIADEMERCTSRAEFCEQLRDRDVDAVFRLNAAGRVYGVTFIDHEQGIVANGSLLGRSFSANVFEQLFHAEAKERGVSWESSAQAQPSSKSPSCPNQSYHPLDAILELADVQAYEVEQQRIRRRKRRHLI
ncbi:conjugal transfer protein MobB [Alistipes sp. An66]|uniref:conjugal transfer protein MobB n=1 Tax=Alistipes sp. An66 TaxID=1965650 RepID=UPI000B39C60E|nr:conjugal transfer protein MobB [Alistipes sp. An66]OUN57439.1 relaxase [Alistipes sp. An66]